MAYQELYDEYVLLLQEKTDCQIALSGLKGGYISTKTISGKKYPYLQYRVDGKLVSEYVGEKQLPYVRTKLEERSRLLERVSELGSQLEKIESAVKILDGELSRKLVILRRCAAMEAMPLDEREKSLAFGKAMTALEGIPAGEKVNRNLEHWASGDFSFQESYLETLRTYSLAEV